MTVSRTIRIAAMSVMLFFLGHASKGQTTDKSDRKNAQWEQDFCVMHPGEDWHITNSDTGIIVQTGHCPTDKEESEEALNKFMANHRDYIRCAANAEAMTSYIETHKLDPREVNSYELGYKELKKAKKLELYAKK